MSRLGQKFGAMHLACIYSPERCAGDVMLSDVCYAAIDEADTLFKEGFAEDVFKVLKPLTVCGPKQEAFDLLLPRPKMDTEHWP
jgi:hypothetical protein